MQCVSKRHAVCRAMHACMHACRIEGDRPVCLLSRKRSAVCSLASRSSSRSFITTRGLFACPAAGERAMRADTTTTPARRTEGVRDGDGRGSEGENNRGSERERKRGGGEGVQRQSNGGVAEGQTGVVSRHSRPGPHSPWWTHDQNHAGKVGKNRWRFQAVLQKREPGNKAAHCASPPRMASAVCRPYCCSWKGEGEGHVPEKLSGECRKSSAAVSW